MYNVQSQAIACSPELGTQYAKACTIIHVTSIVMRKLHESDLNFTL